MNAQQLKNAILQEAITGRLVPQDPNDEPASVLLDKIRKEKAKLVKEGKLKKKDLEEKPISKEEIPFEIPESWEWVRIKDLFVTSSGSTPLSKNPKYYSNGSINWVRTTDLNNGVLNSCEIKITDEAVEDYNLCIIPQDSVCIAMYGGGGTIGKHSIIKFDTTINQSVCAIFPNGYCDMNYVHIFMQYQRPYWMNFAAGSRKDPNINQIIIKNCPFPLPPLSEQHRIVAKIEELLPKVEEYGKAQEALDKLNAELPERLKKSILQEAITGKLVPQDPNDEPASVLLDKIRKEKAKLVKEGKLKKKDLIETPISKDEIPFEIPESWEWVRLKDITTKIVDGDHNPPRGLSYDTGYYMLSSKNINHDKVESLNETRYISVIDWEKCNERTRLNRGDVLLTIVATLGRSCVYEDDIPYCFQRSVSVIQTQIYNYYLKYCFDSSYFQSLMEDKATGTAQRGFYLNQLEEAIIPLPPLAEQHRIVAKIEELLTKIDKLKTK